MGRGLTTAEMLWQKNGGLMPAEGWEKNVRDVLIRAAEGGFFDEAPFEFSPRGGARLRLDLRLDLDDVRKSPSRWVAERAAELLGHPVAAYDLRRGGALDEPGNSWSGQGWAARFWQIVFGRARARYEGKL